ncbi:MAG: hypothetical protein ABFD97_15445 [Syntrophobacter sp.]
MEKKDIGKKVIPTLLATLFTIPAIAGTGDNLIMSQASKEEKPKAALASEAIQQEVIQVLRNGDTDRVTLNIAGQPGTFFRILFSPSGEDKSYNLVPNAQSAIGENGMGSFSFNLRELGKDEVYIKVVTSNAADFSDTRITPKPLILQVEEVQVNERGLRDDINRKLEAEKNKLERKLQPVRTPSAVAGVRG